MLESIYNFIHHPMFILAVGIATVLGMIIVMKINAFIALITAAMVVSILAPGEVGSKISRVAVAFGGAAGGIGIVIALAAVIGKCMLDSGAADRIVRTFVNLLGEKKAPMALMGSGFVLAIPVFFDTVFYLLVPLARSLYRKTGRNYLKYILAISAGGALTHTLVPPTPGPLVMADNLQFDVGVMIIAGLVVAAPSALVGLLVAAVADRLMPIPMRQVGSEPDPEPLPDEELPSLWLSVLPVVLPVVLISTNTVLTVYADAEAAARLKPAEIQEFDALRSALRGGGGKEASFVGQRVLTALREEEAATKTSDQADAEPATPPTESATELILSDEPLTPDQQAQIVAAINRHVLPRRDLYEPDQFIGVPLEPDTRARLNSLTARSKRVEVERANRTLLEDALNTPESTILTPHVWETTRRQWANYSSLVGNANLALLLSAGIALWVLVKKRRLKKAQTVQVVEHSLMSGGVIILITAGGGAFGAMLQEAQVGPAIEGFFKNLLGAGSPQLAYLFLGFALAMVLKIAQGSSTVAMIIGSSMMAAILAQGEPLPYHVAYLATAIGSGSLVGSWMNDSGFWIFAKMGGLTEVEALKSWTIMLCILGVCGLLISVLFATLLPLA